MMVEMMVMMTMVEMMAHKTEPNDYEDDCNLDAKMFAETKKISRVESLKNLILHGKTEPELPPDVFNFPHGCSCR